MNSYAIDLSGGSNGFNASEREALRKVLGYVALFGQNVKITPIFLRRRNHFIGVSPFSVPNDSGNSLNLFDKNDNPSSVSTVMALGVLTFDLDFSLSNVPNFFDTLTSNGVLACRTVVYDTKCQSVREYVDKPYPVQGYLAVSMQLGSNSPVSDMDDFQRFYSLTQGGELITIYIGKCNASQTDFYKPFDKVGLETTIIDQEATIKAVKTLEAQAVKMLRQR